MFGYSNYLAYLCSRESYSRLQRWFAVMVELVDTRDLKSLDQKWLCGFESRSRH